jgi:hypothetical protein
MYIALKRCEVNKMTTIMAAKVKFEIECLLKTSPKVLENMISTPSGLSEWFAEDVNIKGDVYTFIWDGSEEQARLTSGKNTTKIRFQWLQDEEVGNDCHFEMAYNVDPMTKTVVFTVSDYAVEEEVEESKLLWEQQVSDLKRVLGA